MKKIKYRNNYNTQVYSINYKFDSISPAGKFCGTALDLIKRYNELAKEAQGNGNYVEAEVFRQYAEHYRKIITDINERKNIRFANKDSEQAGEKSDISSQPKQETEATPLPSVEENAVQPVEEASETTSLVETKPRTTKKTFTIIDATKETVKPRKTTRSKVKKDVEQSSVNE